MLRCCLLFLGAFLYALTCLGQVERILPRKQSSSLEGTEFVVGFMQNELTERYLRPRLQLFICSQFEAAVTIDYPGFGVAYRKVGQNSVLVENVPVSLMATSSELVQRKGIWIKSDVPIVVYALNTLATSTDTYTAIPVKHLGRNYRTINRQNDRYALQVNNDAVDTMARVSEFMILAVEDATVVDIVPAQLTEYGSSPNRPISITMNKGESYLVKGSNARLQNGDLTSSVISSSKPVGVLSGHVRSGMPAGSSYSKDHLVEMMTPIEKWSTEYVSTPFANAHTYDVIRIVALEANTAVVVTDNTGSRTETFNNAGQYRDLNVSRTTHYKSDKKFAVAQYMMSSGRAGGNSTTGYFDPALVMLPGVNQYVSSALFQFPVLEDQTIPGETQEFYYYISIVADKVALASLKINQQLVSALAPEINSQIVPGTTMHWANVRLELGVHTIQSDTGLFSGVMYGMSHFDSYANLFGVQFDPIELDDISPPTFGLQHDCGAVTGTIQDYSSKTPKLTEVTVVMSETYNYTWTTSLPIDGIGSVLFDARVREINKDAQIVVQAFDDKGNGREWKLFYDAPSYNVTNKLDFPFSSKTEICSTIVIRNTDSTDLRISEVTYFGPTSYVMTPSSGRDLVVKPGDSLSFVICYKYDGSPQSANGTVLVNFGCGLNASVPVNNNVNPAIIVRDLDFGTVLVGDTICRNTVIRSVGKVAVVIDTILPDPAYGSDLVYDLTAITFPVTLQPGDSLMLPICFNPKKNQGYYKNDTVLTESTRLTYGISGRGVQPKVNSIVIDWGKKRVGTVWDSTAILWNTGDAPCIISCNGVTAQNEFDTPNLCSGPTPLMVNQSNVFPVRFHPTMVGVFEYRIPITVNWRFHDTVFVVLKGEGILPSLTTRMIDMGSILVNASKDSTVDFFSLTGVEAVHITEVKSLGPDEIQFDLPALLFNTRKMLPDEKFSGNITFSPKAIGFFRNVIRVRHDGFVGFVEGYDSVVIIGKGLPQDTVGIDVELNGDASVVACNVSQADVEIRNMGNISLTINDIRLLYKGEFNSILQSPEQIPVLESKRYAFSFMAQRGGPDRFTIVVTYNDSLSYTIEHEFAINVPVPEIKVVSPGIVPAGAYTSFVYEVSQASPSDEPVDFSVEFDAGVERFEVTSISDVSVTDRLNSNLNPFMPYTANAKGLTAILTGQVQAPYNVRFTINGTMLWKDPSPLQAKLTKHETPCEYVSASVSEVKIDLCAPKLRVVNFGALPIVELKIVENPVHDAIIIDFESTKEAVVSVSLLSVSGQRIGIMEKFTLQKGQQLCNFSCSNIAAGVYSLVVEYELGKILTPIVVVH